MSLARRRSYRVGMKSARFDSARWVQLVSLMGLLASVGLVGWGLLLGLPNWQGLLGLALGFFHSAARLAVLEWKQRRRRRLDAETRRTRRRALTDGHLRDRNVFLYDL